MIVVVGGSSGIGLATVKAGLVAGHRMRAFARRAESMALEHDSLERMNGDALDPSAIARAISGADAVVLSLGVPVNLKLLTGPITLFSMATKNVLAAMADADVKRLLAVTGFGAGDSSRSIATWQRPAFNILFGKAYADKSCQESLIKQSDLTWTIVRPGMLTNKALVPYEVLVDSNEWRNGVTTRAGVADFLIRQIETPTLVGEAPVVLNS